MTRDPAKVGLTFYTLTVPATAGTFAEASLSPER